MEQHTHDWVLAQYTPKQSVGKINGRPFAELKGASLWLCSCGATKEINYDKVDEVSRQIAIDKEAGLVVDEVVEPQK